MPRKRTKSLFILYLNIMNGDKDNDKATFKPNIREWYNYINLKVGKKMSIFNKL